MTLLCRPAGSASAATRGPAVAAEAAPGLQGGGQAASPLPATPLLYDGPAARSPPRRGRART